MKQRTFTMLKPDAVKRRLTGEILTRFEKRGLKVIAAKTLMISEDLAKTHYGEHSDKPFFNDLISYITSGPVFAMVLEGDDVISLVRKMVGATNPKEADIGTIRGDYGIDTGRNIVHASDSEESAQREINLFFDETEFCDYELPDEDIIYEEP
ncbi:MULTISPECIES: nucleoside-diphosphate kinase [Methanosphaera]|jgi:nucleoside-diphosphate kinase|uniref:Nucleoside diphosphate kinase n=2 Tax=Methanosphaera stadtmanae TaxID=2317 RepID=NDK_METST|nr:MULTISPECIES: nucleoside-diphosphate kinase [Methanosphaera]Q2NGM5.1 RecName: Full=Nucleoside diphosphate kinase; Short=NDK; Short=NDP kinase; AltName: Full=Nucleoside-2-P kinase [Methanosphaera stadtmanae DSM 3091]ABC57028.1 nucleoside diphosphate kinase [Methanosphaera stadtmanae DSM 3091]MDO5822678.1 nucleoside-diphosphate kinase [Methanosphaera sp.]MEE0488936.1 nucleoside-diphosphate kinase [Methanosphaera stadtmanae]OEC90578.1 nucleoside-diphosphate kinase [Methanosphaera sp. A6]RAP03